MARRKSQSSLTKTPSNEVKALEKSQAKTPTKVNKHFKGIDKNGREVWEVEKILARKTDLMGKKHYLVKWLGFPKAEATWEPEESFTYDPETLQKDKSFKEISSDVKPDQDVTTIRIKLDKLTEISTNKSENTESNSESQGSAKKKSTRKKKAAQFATQDQDQIDKLDDEDAMSEEWKKNEVRIAVQSQVNHNPLPQEVVIPSDLDTEFFLRNMGAEIPNRKSVDYSNSKTEFYVPKDSPSFVTSHRNGKMICYEEDDEYLKITPEDYDSIMYPKNQQQGREFNFIKDSLYPSQNEEAFMGHPTKKICKGNSSDTYEYTIKRVDAKSMKLEIVCTEKLRNEMLYTQWFDVQQTAKICPNEGIDFLLKYAGFQVNSK